MKKEIIVEGKTVEAAISAACEELGVSADAVTHEVLEEAKKGFLGMGSTPAKVRVTYTVKPEDAAVAFIRQLLSDMEIDAEITVSDTKDADKRISVTGEKAGILIGHHGDTLDAIQYLVNLAVNKKEENEERAYTRISVDVENYRAKREDTLRSLARRMAERVKKYRRSVTLEPMNPHERRIIHSEVQNIAGVTTVSIGQENSRRVVISLDRPKKTEEPIEY